MVRCSLSVHWLPFPLWGRTSKQREPYTNCLDRVQGPAITIAIAGSTGEQEQRQQQPARQGQGQRQAEMSQAWPGIRTFIVYYSGPAPTRAEIKPRLCAGDDIKLRDPRLRAMKQRYGRHGFVP